MSHKVQTANITNIARDVTKISSSQSLGTTGNNMNMKKKKKKKKKKTKSEAKMYKNSLWSHPLKIVRRLYLAHDLMA